MTYSTTVRSGERMTYKGNTFHNRTASIVGIRVTVTPEGEPVKVKWSAHGVAAFNAGRMGVVDPSGYAEVNASLDSSLPQYVEGDGTIVFA